MAKVTRLINAQHTRDGDGVLIQRSIGSHQLSEHDPFLLLDEIRSDDSADYIGGFPPHPHRGFETVTYMLDGRMRHRDSQGNNGVIEPGGVQWMTAGKGILHSEMPEQTEGRLWGFQLWINLAAAEKMREPRYQELTADQIPELSPSNGVLVRLIAGSLNGVKGPVTGISSHPMLADVQMEEDAHARIDIPKGYNSVLYVYQGSLMVRDVVVASQQLAVLSDGGGVTVEASTEGARALLISAHPMNEPVARYGPFVMNTRAEIQQAVNDLNSGAFGRM
ncbi:pirin family protein [Halioxenophilus aromaticivorans]|uniref:Pirin family protein n=1 Tax=Halioxenophilus aromaticivorans TaxID=1306992 RepID=A0AAV3U5D7_9ALTE